MPRRYCEHCGAEVPRRALACPECGSDDQTGWADEDTRHDALWDTFDENEEYEEVVRELRPPGETTGARRDVVLAIIALITIAAFVLATVL